VDSKQALRQQADLRRSVSVDLTHIVGALIARAERVASYVPFGTEPGVPPRLGWLLPVLLPDGDLDWAAYDGRLTSGRPPEPVGNRLGVDAIATCDLVLVPALLVDRRGVRLGKGGGSYDRALARATGLTVALLHDGELVEALPTEPHDVPVDAVVTPSGGLVHLTGKM
jgi:5-formyltetrahydrofolate cyclo-ligase